MMASMLVTVLFSISVSTGSWRGRRFHVVALRFPFFVIRLVDVHISFMAWYAVSTGAWRWAMLIACVASVCWTRTSTINLPEWVVR